MTEIKGKISRILEAEAAAIAAIKVTDAFEDAVNTFMQGSGKIVCPGIGKAGFMAQKFATVLCSTGTPAAFIHPAEDANGDLGLIASNDVIVAFSTSGKTRGSDRAGPAQPTSHASESHRDHLPSKF
jgi:arabinose-5-phosphate isomerase